MNKTKLSIVVVLCTVFSVTVMIINNHPEFINNSEKFIYGNTKNLGSMSSSRVQKKNVKNEDHKNESSTEKAPVKEQSGNSDNRDDRNKDDEITLKDSGIRLTLKEVRENKLSLMKDNIIEDMKDYYDSKNEKENKDISVSSSITTKETNESENKISRNKSIDKSFQGLSLQDKDKLLSIASTLSVLDNAKINEYIDKNTIEGVRDAIKLFKDRLSDKEYEKIKPVADKYLNSNQVNEDKSN